MSEEKVRRSGRRIQQGAQVHCENLVFRVFNVIELKNRENMERNNRKDVNKEEKETQKR